MGSRQPARENAGTSTSHYELREQPITQDEYTDVWWGIARILATHPARSADDGMILARATLQAAWQAVEYLRDKQADDERSTEL